MKIDLTKVDPARFYLNVRGEHVLVIPRKNNWEWHDSELYQRSALCLSDGTVVSSGWPKFFNVGERGPESVQALAAACRAGRVYAMPKHDGSLIVASWVNGKTHLRTRGSDTLGDFEAAVLPLMRKQHPEVFDEKFWYGDSLSCLYEYVSPDNQVILKYDEPELKFIGSVQQDGRIIPVVEELLPNKVEDLEVFMSTVAAQENIEGFVLYEHLDNGDWRLHKVKTDWYKQLHALASQVSLTRLKELVLGQNIRTLDELKGYFQAQGLDWECITWAEEPFKKFAEHRSYCEARAGVLRQELLDRMASMGSLSRKGRALLAQEVDTGGWFGYLMQVALGDEARAQKALQKKIEDI